MKNTSLVLWLLSALALGSAYPARSQDLPSTQPKLITIWREAVKIGLSEEHAKHEAGFPAAFEKAKSPEYYLAMTSLTGPNEAWYITPSESYANIGAAMKREDNDRDLSAKLTRLGRADARYITALNIIQAQARTDLSAGPFPDLAKARFFAITTYRVRPGHEGQFEAAAKAYGAARMRVAPKTGFRVYQVVAGMPSPTFLIFSSVENYGDFDAMTIAHQESLKALTSEEQTARQNFQKEGVISTEMNRFKVDPVQSYVSKETRAKDPEFWSRK
jgi:hypothetical protein